MLLGALALAEGCSSDDSSSGGGSGDYAPAGNGVAMPELEACKAITAAEDTRLSCGPKTRPPCPAYINKGNEPCSMYDQGTVQACVEWIAKLSCADFKTKKCIVKVLPGTAPNGCPPPVDGGDDSGQDAGSDASDAGEDSTADAPEDVVSDASDAGDAASDAATDGPIEAGDAAGD